MSLAVSLIVLLAALAAAVARRPRVPGPAVAAAGALLLLATGIVGAHQAAHAIRELGPTIGFLAALLVLADGCRREGLFDALGHLLATRSRGDQRRLLALVFAAASAVTILLGLDATVVLLTPVMLVCAARLRAEPRATSYACVHLANSASLLLPVSNLTNLLAFRASGLSFARFGVLMLLPTAWAVAVDWVALRRLVPDRAGPPRPAIAADAPDADHPKGVPAFALAILALTLAGFLASSLLGVAPVWIATAGAVLITLPALRSPAPTVRELVHAVQPGFIVFVLGLAVIVAAVGARGLQSAIRDILPSTSAAHPSLPALLLIAAIAAVVANLVNNLPATLLLVPVAAAHGVGPVLAVLVGVNIGPNLTEVGSLATLLWRRAMAADGTSLPRREFALLGALTVPPALVGATALMWLALRVVGG
ncbi:MAG TPA: SLC13 family permease [Solirubrobacteraceae bacterium]|nr:SLC13 family permease [Solirubrobacteraceae bacterium]